MLRNKRYGPRVLAGRDRRHVPDDGLERIHVGGANEQDAALGIFGCDFIEEGACDIGFDDARQRPRVGHRITEYPRGDPALLENVLLRGRRVDRLEHVVVLRPDEGEGRNQRAGADPGDDLEFRPRAGCGPAVEEAGTIGAVVAAAGDGEEVGRRQIAALSLARKPGLLLGKGGASFRCETFGFAGDQEAKRAERRSGLECCRCRNRGQPVGSAAASNSQLRGGQDQQTLVPTSKWPCRHSHSWVNSGVGELCGYP